MYEGAHDIHNVSNHIFFWCLCNIYSLFFCLLVLTFSTPFYLPFLWGGALCVRGGGDCLTPLPIYSIPFCVGLVPLAP